jgi:branched-chain amino acid transport system substrate-binding protein
MSTLFALRRPIAARAVVGLLVVGLASAACSSSPAASPSAGAPSSTPGTSTAASSTPGTSIAAATAALPAEVTIGATMDLTGPGAVYGAMMSHGMQVAVDEINAAGGVKGAVKLNLVVSDDVGQAGLAVTQMRDLVSKNGAIAIASMYSAPPLAQQSVGESLKVAVLNAGGGDPTLTGHPWLFNNVLTSDQLLAAVMSYLKDKKSVGKVAMIVSTDFSADGITRFQSLSKTVYGSDFTSFQTIDPTNVTDLTPQFQAIIATSPDAIVVELSGAALEVAFKDLARLGWKGPIIGDVTTLSSPEATTGPLAAQNYIGTTSFAGAPASLVAEWKTKYPDQTPDYYGANYYNVIKFVAEAMAYGIDQGWGVSGESLQKALDAGQTFSNGCCGDFHYNASHGAGANVEIDTIANGKPTKIGELIAPQT